MTECLLSIQTKLFLLFSHKHSTSQTFDQLIVVQRQLLLYSCFHMQNVINNYTNITVNRKII